MRHEKLELSNYHKEVDNILDKIKGQNGQVNNLSHSLWEAKESKKTIYIFGIESQIVNALKLAIDFRTQLNVDAIAPYSINHLHNYEFFRSWLTQCNLNEGDIVLTIASKVSKAEELKNLTAIEKEIRQKAGKIKHIYLCDPAEDRKPEQTSDECFIKANDFVSDESVLVMIKNFIKHKFFAYKKDQAAKTPQTLSQLQERLKKCKDNANQLETFKALIDLGEFCRVVENNVTVAEAHFREAETLKSERLDVLYKTELDKKNFEKISYEEYFLKLYRNLGALYTSRDLNTSIRYYSNAEKYADSLAALIVSRQEGFSDANLNEIICAVSRWHASYAFVLERKSGGLDENRFILDHYEKAINYASHIKNAAGEKNLYMANFRSNYVDALFRAGNCDEASNLHGNRGMLLQEIRYVQVQYTMLSEQSKKYMPFILFNDGLCCLHENLPGEAASRFNDTLKYCRILQNGLNDNNPIVAKTRLYLWWIYYEYNCNHLYADEVKTGEKSPVEVAAFENLQGAYKYVTNQEDANKDKSLVAKICLYMGLYHFLNKDYTPAITEIRIALGLRKSHFNENHIGILSATCYLVLVETRANTNSDSCESEIFKIVSFLKGKALTYTRNFPLALARVYFIIGEIYWAIFENTKNSSHINTAIFYLRSGESIQKEKLKIPSDLEHKILEKTTRLLKHITAKRQNITIDQGAKKMPIKDKIFECLRSHWPNTSDSPKEFFNHMSDYGLTWPDLLSQAIFTDVDAPLSLEALIKLVEYRDTIDFNLYIEAVKKLFPDDKFSVDGFGQRRGEFHIEVHAGPSVEGRREHQFICDISFTSPGSRTVTSDVDTTITPDIEFLVDRQMENAHLLGSGSDYTTRLWASIIREFDALNQDTFKMVSGLHRDTNAYSAGFLSTSAKDEEELGETKFIPSEIRQVYPKFSYFKQMLNSDKFDLLSNTVLNNFIEVQRTRKHALEMAASLFPLRLTLSEEAWTDFANRLRDQVQMGWRSNTNDVEDILALVGEWFNYRQQTLQNKQKEIQSKWTLPSHYHSELAEKNRGLAAYNECYVDHLVELSSINHQIYQCYIDLFNARHILREGSEEMSLLDQLNAAKTDLAAKKQTLEIYEQPKNPRYQKPQKKRATLAVSRAQDALYELTVKNVEKFEKLARDMVTRQEQQIKANLFANEAYFNYAAVCHVVKAKQQGIDIKLTRHIILCSILQQIGCYLHHQKEAKSEGQKSAYVLWKTAKYGERISDMLKRADQENCPKNHLSALSLSEEQSALLAALGQAEVCRKQQGGLRATLVELGKCYDDNQSLFTKASTLLQDLAIQIVKVVYQTKLSFPQEGESSVVSKSTLFQKWRNTFIATTEETQTSPSL